MFAHASPAPTERERLSIRSFAPLHALCRAKMQASPLQKRKQLDADIAAPEASKETRTEAHMPLDRLPPEILMRVLRVLRLQVSQTGLIAKMANTGAHTTAQPYLHLMGIVT